MIRNEVLLAKPALPVMQFLLGGVDELNHIQFVGEDERTAVQHEHRQIGEQHGMYGDETGPPLSGLAQDGGEKINSKW